MMSVAGELTARLQAWRAGEAGARDALDAEVYAALKRMARGRLSGEGSTTLDPTALVHEAVARLLDSSVDASSRTHFYALAALQMRSVLVDHARRRRAQKRGGDVLQVTLDLDLAQTACDGDTLLDLHAALEELAGHDPRCARAIELAYFGGLTQQQIAHVTDASVAAVERDLKFGRAWLRRRLR